MRIEIGQRVSPKGMTRDGITYGYVIDVDTEQHRGPAALVYWPEIDSEGVWPIRDLVW